MRETKDEVIRKFKSTWSTSKDLKKDFPSLKHLFRGELSDRVEYENIPYGFFAVRGLLQGKEKGSESTISLILGDQVLKPKNGTDLQLIVLRGELRVRLNDYSESILNPYSGIIVPNDKILNLEARSDAYYYLGKLKRK